MLIVSFWSDERLKRMKEVGIKKKMNYSTLARKTEKAVWSKKYHIISYNKFYEQKYDAITTTLVVFVKVVLVARCRYRFVVLEANKKHVSRVAIGTHFSILCTYNSFNDERNRCTCLFCLCLCLCLCVPVGHICIIHL